MVSSEYEIGGFCSIQGGSGIEEINYCYWDTQTSGTTESDGGTGKTTAEMMMQSTFETWDFDEIWCMAENETYPHLKAIEDCETISVNENIRLIVEVLKQFRMKSSENMQAISDDFNAKIKELYEKKSIDNITEEEKKAIETIRQAVKAVSNNLYYAQLLNIIQSIREETNRIISRKGP